MTFPSAQDFPPGMVDHLVEGQKALNRALFWAVDHPEEARRNRMMWRARDMVWNILNPECCEDDWYCPHCGQEIL